MDGVIAYFCHRSQPIGLLFACLAPVVLAVAGGCQLVSQTDNAEGVRMFQQAYYQGALQKFHSALEADPNNPDAYYNLAATYHQMGKLYQQKPDIDQAFSYYHQCLDKNRNHQDCYRGLAVLLMEQGRTPEAFQLIQGWVDRNPAMAAPQIELARLCEETGDKEQAQQHLIEALAVDPNNATALAALGKLREESGDTAQALANYQRSLSINRFQPQVAARVASLQMSGGAGGPTPPGGTRMVAAPDATQVR